MEELELPGGTWQGEAKDGVPHGHGTFTFASGSKYVAEWEYGEEVG
jgi:hypothetical protein